MKNKIRLIDVSMLSSYMGKSLTVFVTIFVVGIAVSALIGDGGIEKNVVRVCVPGGPRPGEAVNTYEPLRALLGRETRQPVILVERSGQWPKGCDLYVMPVDEFFRWEGDLDVTALYEIGPSDRQNDKAVLIAPQSERDLDVSRVTTAEVAFVHPKSVNGFWVQADGLMRAGVGWAKGTEFRFEGALGDATRVICGVSIGSFGLGACRLSEVSALSETGVIDAGQVRVVWSGDALPETVIAVNVREAGYFGARIGLIAKLLENEAAAKGQSDSVRLLKAIGVCRLDRVDPVRMGRVRGLFDRYDALSASLTAVRP
jgi:hypothetical protein